MEIYLAVAHCSALLQIRISFVMEIILQFLNQKLDLN